MLLLKNACVMTMTEAPFIGDVAVEGTKIKAVGKDLAFEGAQEIDLKGMTLMPGMVDAHNHVSMMEDSLWLEGLDCNEMTDPCTPELRCIDSIYPADRNFEEACQAGVTTCVIGPGSCNAFGGTFGAFKTKKGLVEDKLFRYPVAMKSALGENVKSIYRSKSMAPETRMGIANVMRSALLAAREYDRKIQEAGEDTSIRPERNLKMEALLPVIHRELPVKFHAHRADDIMTAIRVAEEFNLRYTLEHCTEGYLITDALKKALSRGCEGIIIGPLLISRRKPEARNLSIEAPRILWEAGIEFAIMSDHSIIPVDQLKVSAAMAVREGLPADVALRAITINGAKITGIADRVGSIEPGKDADLAVFPGDPLDLRVRCVMTLIDGEIVYRSI